MVITRQPTMNSLQASTIHEFTVIKCPYNCQDSFTSWELLQHEFICPSTLFICPCCPNWMGSAEDCKRHFSKFVSQSDSEYFPFTLSGGLIKVIKSGDEFYVFNCYYDSKIECFWASVKYVGPYSYAQRRYFKLRLKRANNKEYQFGKQVEAAYDWRIHRSSAMKIPMKAFSESEQVQLQIKVYCRKTVFPEVAKNNLLKDMCCRVCEVFMNGPIIQNYLGYSTCQDCNIEKLGVHASRNLTMESLSKILFKIKAEDEEFNNKELLKETECMICLDHMRGPIKSCVSGHSICSYCRSKLKVCPICRQQFNVYRNLHLERITNRMHYKCMNADNGCTFTALPYCIDQHESKCGYGSGSKCVKH